MVVTHILILLILWHFLADFPLQGPFLSEFKNPKTLMPPHRRELNIIWPWCMLAHCVIQAGGAYIIIGWWPVFVGELVAHFIIDYAKCRGHISFGVDQMLHLSCKVLWIVLLVMQ